MDPAANEKEVKLEDFNWDEPGDFFGIEGTAPVADEIKTVTEVVTKDPKPTKASGEEEEEENDPAPAGEEEDESFFKENETKDAPASDNPYQELYAEMRKEGFLNTDLEEGVVLDKEKFFELQDQEIESRVDEAINGFLAELDEDGAAFLKFKKEGGSTEDFFKVYGKTNDLPEGDIDDESYQERVSRYYYKNIEGLDPEDVDDKIEWLKDSNKLEKYAIKMDTDLKKRQEEQKANLQKQAKAEAAEAEKRRKAFVDNIQETLDNTNEIDRFKFTPAKKKELYAFITKPSIKVGTNQYVTPFQQKLRSALADTNKMLVLAKLLSEDFDVSDVVAATTTAQTKKVQDELQRKKAGVPNSTGATGGKGRSLAEFF